MLRSQVHSALLLAVFALGGLVAPVLHDAAHAGERAAERAEHLAAGHHHHAASETHDAEADAPCPEPFALDLQCVLCHVVTTKLATAPFAVVPPVRASHVQAVHDERAASAVALGYSSRGPPAA